MPITAAGGREPMTWPSSQLMQHRRRDRRWSQRFEAVKAALPGDASRACATPPSSLFAERGLPHRRVEEWKYTDLRALMREAAPLADEAVGRGSRRGALGRARLRRRRRSRLAVRQRPFRARAPSDHELPAGVEVVPLAEALAAGHPLVAETRRDRARPRQRRSMPAQHRLHDRRRGDPRRRRRRSSARCICASSRAAPAAVATATRVLVVVEEGASRDAVESARRRGRRGASAERRRRDRSPATGANVRHVRLNAEGDGRSRCRRCRRGSARDVVVQQHQRRDRRRRVAPSGLR